ncbi:MIP/aquaporin family protein [Thiocapsa roseopersicina]|uniref:Glycerol uptake facilitator protein n=1 Tax=Thiocapsa roseopersicina TaxID=1058 RepID=A0A1H3CPW3_THIRO|nr:MIP/aquaporin family protein [Thiocapsa roseopersicina]SDX56177.1 glycerol uptake facilitator protein [Thiocapsa roseopersicina]
MTPFFGELIGTALLILLGNGVVANVLLTGTKGQNGGWIVIVWGWGMAVFVAVFTVAAFSGAHLNPAVSVGLAVAGKFEWGQVPAYVLAQFIGAMIGAVLVWLTYWPHFARTEDPDLKLACFCTAPAVRNAPSNLFSEIIGSFVLVFAVLFLAVSVFGLGALDALPVGLLVLAIGLSLGGTTGYAINPARDLGPRIVHALLPMPGGKRDSDWGYAWVPVVGPLLGAGLAGLLYLVLQDPTSVQFR